MDGITINEDKWGKAALAGGFTVLPNHLLAINQFLPKEQSVSPTEMLVLLQILASWWSKDKLPFPSKATIASRAGLSSRQVQRALTGLEQKGLLQRLTRYNQTMSRASNQFDLAGLVAEVTKAAEGNPAAFKRQARSIAQVKDAIS